MVWTDLHATLLAEALEKLLGRPEPGSIAFVRCLSPEVIEALAADQRFALRGWQVQRVADRDSVEGRTITADHAVELREEKAEPLLLLVDTALAGAGMDGIY